MNLSWYVLRVKEANGFISRRILFKILTVLMLMFGEAYFIYGKFCRVLNFGIYKNKKIP